MAPRTPVILVLLLTLTAGCGGNGKRPDPVGPKGGGAPEGREPVTVTVPRLCYDQMAEFVNRQQLLLADTIVIDASSDPFFMAVTASNDPDAVEKTEAVDVENKINILRLRNRTSHDNIESVLPKIRVGDGFEIVATREILVRFHNKLDPKRPIYFDLEAAGRVVYHDSHADRERRGDRLAMALEVKQADDGYMFASKIR